MLSVVFLRKQVLLLYFRLYEDREDIFLLFIETETLTELCQLRNKNILK
jgi:uncharacterized protein (DUF952 family)